MDLKKELENIFTGDIDNSEGTLTKYSHDASLFTVRPQYVLFPKNAEDVKNLVVWVNQNKKKYDGAAFGGAPLAITCRCAGTDMSGGSIGESLILDFTRYMNTLINFDNPEAITVQPGMFYRDFEKITLSKNMLLPCYTASKSLNAMGGMFGNNSAGERTLQYGKTQDYILETKVVFSDGREYIVKPLTKKELYGKIAQGDFEGDIYKNIFALINENKDALAKAKPNVTKNSSGYYLWNVWDAEKEIFDLNKVIVGSQGTLGIATEITFRLIQPKAYTNLVVVFLRDINVVPELVNKVLKFDPQTLESYDDKTFLLVLKYIVSFAKLLGVGKLFKLIFSFGPETLMTLRHGFPHLILLIEFTGDTKEEADTKTKEALKELKTFKNIGVHLTKGAFEAEKYWTIRREAFNLIRFHLKKMKSEAFVDDVIVRPEMLPQFFPALYKILGEYKSQMTFAVGGHVGDGNMHIYTLLNPHNPNLKKIVMDVAEQVYALVIKLGGSITAEHNDGIMRSPFLTEMFGEKIYTLFKETKQLFDPHNIFNPGKKIGATKQYITDHIVQA
jgi:FAD/FMN-containing dehydrogenase